MQNILYRHVPTDRPTQHLTGLTTKTPASKPVQAELLLSAALHLMSHYSVRSASPEGGTTCLKLASVIERHLKALSELPGLTPVLLATCQQLHEQWANLIDDQLRRQQKKHRYTLGLF
ncbi:hypothetical protein ACO0K2_15030 [Undibacterium sp. MH2W]|uniref:hypothetical protein n=1 Tax=Undibacterium sp. MH2W TaxID=3413044 RepID=UPI003BF1AAEC